MMLCVKGSFHPAHFYQKWRFGVAEGLTELRCFTQHEGVRPELADGSVIETLITHTLLQAFSHQDVHHVAPRANGTEYTDAERAEEKQQCVTEAAFQTSQCVTVFLRALKAKKEQKLKFTLAQKLEISSWINYTNLSFIIM